MQILRDTSVYNYFDWPIYIMQWIWKKRLSSCPIGNLDLKLLLTYIICSTYFSKYYIEPTTIWVCFYSGC